MKRIYFTLFTSLFFLSQVMGQACLPDGITFTTQEQIDSFAINYPGCIEIEGNVLILSSNGITSLNGLSQIISIGGNLETTNTSLVSFMGFDNLTSIGGDMTIANNNSLSGFTGLDNLISIGGDLDFFYNDVLQNFIGLDNLTSIGGDFNAYESYALTSFTGLGNLTSISGDLSVNYSFLSDFIGLDNLTSIGAKLRVFYCSNMTSLTGLENLTSIGGGLEIHYSGLISLAALDNITSIGGNLIIYDNDALTSLVGLNNVTSIDGHLDVGNNDALLSLMELENLTSTGGCFIYDNNALTNLAGLENLTSINGLLSIYDNDALTSLMGLENLSSINGGLLIKGNNVLNSLVGLDNIDDFLISYLWVYLNPNLSICGLPNICNYLVNGTAYEIYDNAVNCNSDVEILNTCSNLSKIQVLSYYDLNQNKIKDNGEPDYMNSTVLIEPEALSFFPNPQNGSTFFLEPGNYTVSYDLSNTNWQLTTDSTSYFVSLAANEADTIYFGIYPTQEISEQIAFINAPPARCNEIITFELSTKNLGTTITSGILWFAADSNATSIDFIDIPDTIVAPNLYGWNFTNLYPSQTFSVQIDIGIPGPPDFPLGDLLNFNTYINYTDVNGAQTSSLFEYHTEVQCSFDPNDKLVFPARNIDFLENYTLFDESLFYTVRFQNTGNAEAYDVVILDTLDANLDWTTFQYLSSSHADVLTTTMNEEGILTFDFTDIFLPDSTSNFEGSQGYVSYLIKANSGLAENTIIENSAGIYFDLNPPVITNTTENVMVSVLPTISTTSPEDVQEITIIPNPNTGLFEISGIAEGDYTILNTAGQIIQRGLLSSDVSIDISAVPRGVYFISIQIDEQAVVKRVIKM